MLLIGMFLSFTCSDGATKIVGKVLTGNPHVKNGSHHGFRFIKFPGKKEKHVLIRSETRFRLNF